MRTQVGQSEDTAFWQEALDRMVGRVAESTESNLDGFPHYGDQNSGEWTTTPDGFWTGGFWIGELWLASSLTGKKAFHDEAQKWLGRLEARVDSGTVFRGFLFYYGAVTGARLHGDALAEELAVRAARSVARQFDAKAGLIPLGAGAEEAHSVGDGEANIDGLPASPLMLWAAAHAGEPELRRIALDHAYNSAKFFIRPDGGVIQSASFDTATGELTRRYTHKGYADDSIWTRAQAWAMLGYVLAASLEKDEPRLVELAEKVADWWLDNIPNDLVAYWDFSAPVTPETKRDTSGTAIAAAALLKLASIHPDKAKANRYEQIARDTARALVEGHLTKDGILADGCFDPKNNKATSNELIWGDYFLLETLGYLSGRLRIAI